MSTAWTLADMSPGLRKGVGRESPRATLAEEPDAGNPLVRSWRGAELGNRSAYSTTAFSTVPRCPPWRPRPATCSAPSALAPRGGRLGQPHRPLALRAEGGGRAAGWGRRGGSVRPSPSPEVSEAAGAAARLFAHEGARVVLTDIKEEMGFKTAEQICAIGGEALFVRHDVTSEEEWQEVMPFPRCVR